MSSLRQRLKLPGTYLTALAVLVVGCVADSFLPPRLQVTGCVYVLTVRGYQVLLRPALKKYIACRYVPTCSEYSIQAVQFYGIRKGLLLTWQRVNSCQRIIRMGTSDPVLPGR
jgi:putative membrane protein insertion efficiency factor